MNVPEQEGDRNTANSTLLAVVMHGRQKANEQTKTARRRLLANKRLLWSNCLCSVSD